MTSKLAIIYRQFREMVDAHDAGGCRQRPPGKAVAIRTSWADMERLGLDEGELVYPSKGIRVIAGGQYGSFVVICDAGCEKGPRPGVEDEVPADPDELVVEVDAEPARKDRKKVEV